MDFGKWNILIQTFLAKNKELNLSAIRTAEDVYTKHIQDALAIKDVINFEAWSQIADVGTGWWFPLFPLAIENTQCNFIGIDSRKKKTVAVQAIADELWLSNVKLVRTRIEEHQKKYNYVTARAVAYSDTLLDRSTPLLKARGKIILYKVRDREEKKVLLKSAKKRWLKLIKEHHYQLFDGDIDRVIYVLEKL